MPANPFLLTLGVIDFNSIFHLLLIWLYLLCIYHIQNNQIKRCNVSDITVWCMRTTNHPSCQSFGKTAVSVQCADIVKCIWWTISNNRFWDPTERTIQFLPRRFRKKYYAITFLFTIVNLYRIVNLPFFSMLHKSDPGLTYQPYNTPENRHLSLCYRFPFPGVCESRIISHRLTYFWFYLNVCYLLAYILYIYAYCTYFSRIILSAPEA